MRTIVPLNFNNYRFSPLIFLFYPLRVYFFLLRVTILHKSLVQDYICRRLLPVKVQMALPIQVFIFFGFFFPCIHILHSKITLIVWIPAIRVAVAVMALSHWHRDDPASPSRAAEPEAGSVQTALLSLQLRVRSRSRSRVLRHRSESDSKSNLNTCTGTVLQFSTYVTTCYRTYTYLLQWHCIRSRRLIMARALQRYYSRCMIMMPWARGQA